MCRYRQPLGYLGAIGPVQLPRPLGYPADSLGHRLLEGRQSAFGPGGDNTTSYLSYGSHRRLERQPPRLHPLLGTKQRCQPLADTFARYAPGTGARHSSYRRPNAGRSAQDTATDTSQYREDGRGYVTPYVEDITPLGFWWIDPPHAPLLKDADLPLTIPVLGEVDRIKPACGQDVHGPLGRPRK